MTRVTKAMGGFRPPERIGDVWADAAEFWLALAACWRRSPGVIVAPPGGILGTEAEVMAGLRHVGSRYRRGDRSPPVRFFAGDREQEDVAPWLAGQDERDLATMASRVATADRSGRAGLLVGQFQILEPTIWQRSLAFVRALADHVHEPFGSTALDFFQTNQASGFVGVHKDSQDVLTFVVAGWKRFYLWPFEVFRHAAGLTEADSEMSYVLKGFDWRPYRSQAQVVEGGPGQLLYWPREYWHVSENDLTGAATLALGTMSTSQSDEAESVGRQLRVCTGGGFREIAAATKAFLPNDDPWVWMPIHGSVAWRREQDVMWWAANGHVLQVPWNPDVICVFEALAGGRAWRTSALLDLTPGTRRGSRTAHRALLGLLTLLLRCHALAVATDAPEMAQTGFLA